MNKNIKICYVASVDSTIRFILLNHLKFLRSQGYEVHAVCSSGKWIKDIEVAGIKIKNIKFKRRISPFYDLITLSKLFFYLKKEKFDIVHTHTPKAGLLGRLAAKLAGVPIIFHTVHGYYFQKKDPYFKRKFFIFFEKIAAKCSDIIFFVNKEDMGTTVKEKICKEEKTKYFGGGVDLNWFSPGLFSKEFILKKKKSLGIAPNKKIVGIMARLVQEKGYLDLFKAFKQVIVEYPNLLLMIIGQEEPEKKDRVNINIVKEYGIQKEVLYLGERQDINELLAVIDIFVLPSYREGLGISLLEAQAMEKPVVATSIRGCQEAVENGKTGILVPKKNPERLAEAIIYFLVNPKTAENMGKVGRKKVTEEFDERIVFDRINKCYTELIKIKLKNGSS